MANMAAAHDSKTYVKMFSFRNYFFRAPASMFSKIFGVQNPSAESHFLSNLKLFNSWMDCMLIECRRIKMFKECADLFMLPKQLKADFIGTQKNIRCSHCLLTVGSYRA